MRNKMRKQVATLKEHGVRFFFFLLFLAVLPSYAAGVTFTTKIKPECGTSADGKITVKISSGTPNYTYELWDTIPYLLPANPHRLQRVLSTPVDSTVFSGLVKRNYWVYVMDGSSGTWQKITMPRNPSLSTSFISVTKGLTCFSSTDGILKANPVGGTAPYTYKWSASAGNQTTQSATSIGQATHIVTITDAATCSVSPAIFFIYGANDSVPADITIDPDPAITTPTCTGSSQGTLTVAAAGGTGTLSYSITNGGAAGYQASNVFTNLAAGSYQVWVKDVRACKMQGSNATVSANPLPVATAASNSPVCVAQPLSLLAGPAAMTSYAWTGPLGYSSALQNPVVSPSATLAMAGVYTLIVTDANGCKDTITTTVTVSNPPTITLGANPTVCSGTTSSNLTYSATTNSPNQYSIDYNAAANAAGFVDVVNAALPASPITLTVPGAAAAATYNAILTVTNSTTGCSSINYAITVTINPSPTISLGANPAVCRGTTSTNLTYSATSGSPNQYSIDFDATANAAGFTDVSNVALPASPIVVTIPGAAAAATYNAVLTVRNSGTTCISSSYPITVTVNPVPAITLGANPSVCRGTTTANLTYSATTGTPNQYSIDYDATANAAGFTDVTNSALPASPIVLTVPAAAAAATYNAILTVRNSLTTCGSISYPITVTVNLVPTITLGANPIVCQGSLSTNLTYSATTGTPNQYSIDFDATANTAGFADVTNAALLASPIVITVPGAAAAATYNAILTVRNSGTTCSSISYPITVTVNPIPTITLGSNPIVCQGTTTASLTYSATTGTPNQYSIDFDATANAAGFADVTNVALPASPIVITVPVAAAAATYNAVLTVRNSGTACSSISYPITVTVSSIPAITLGANPAVCRGTTTANLTYSATTGTPNQYSIDYDATANAAGFTDVINGVLPASPIVLTIPGAAAAATYNGTLTVRNSTSGCSSISYAITVTVNPVPTITLGASPAVCRGTTTANLTYSATTGTPNQYSIDYDATANAAGFIDVTNVALPASPIVVTIPGAAAAATYNAILTVRNSGTTCSSISYPITVTVNAIPTITLGANPTVCQGTTTASLTYSATTGTPNQYSIDFDATANAAGFVDLTNVVLPSSPIVIAVPGAAAAATYNALLTVRNSTTTCGSSSYAVTLTVTALPTITLGANPAVCRGITTANLSYSATTGTPNQYSIDFDATANTAGFTDVVNAVLPGSPIVITVPGAAAAATYNAILSVRNSGTTCSSISYNITVTVNPIPAISLGANPAVCSGTTTANLTYSATTGTPNQYSIDYDATANAAGFIDVNNGALPASPILLTVPAAAAPATYNGILTVRNSGTTCSSISYPITVTINAIPTISLGANPSVCQGTTTASLSYSGTTGTPNQYSIDFDATANAAGFTDITNVALPVSPIALTVPGAAAAATYNAVLTVRNSTTGCGSSSYPITLTVTALPTITLGANPNVCQGSTTANLTYSATTGTPNQYSIDFNAAANIAGFTDIVNAVLPASPIIITVPGAAAAATYNAVLTVRNSGTTCTSISYPVTVTVNPIPTISLGANPSVCRGTTTANLSYSATGGTPNQYSIDFDATANAAGFLDVTNVALPASPIVITVPGAAATATYNAVLTVRNSVSGCSSISYPVTVTVNPIPTISLGANPALCQGTTTANLTYSATTGTPNQYSIDYDATANAAGFADVTNAALPVSPIVLTIPGAAAAATYNGVLTVRNSGTTCSSISYPITVTVNAIPTISLGANPAVCRGVTLANLTYSATTGTPNQYSIDFDATANLAGFVDIVNTGIPVSPIGITVPGAAAPATYNAILTVRNSTTTCGSISYPITVKVNALPVPAAANNGPVCEGNALSLTGTPNGMSTYSWTGPLAFSSNAQNPSVSLAATAGMAGVYTLTVTDPNACSANTTTTVVVTLLPVITAGSDASVCENSSYTVADASVSGATSILWTHNGHGSLSGAGTANPTYTPGIGDANTVVTLTLTTQNGTCPKTDQMDLLVEGAPVVDAGSDATICSGNDFFASEATVSNAGGGVMWSTSGDGIFDNALALNPTYTPGSNDMLNGTVSLYLDGFGLGACVFVRDSMHLFIPPALKASVGAPAPFIIGASTQIQVKLKTSGHKPVQDLSIFLVAPDGLLHMPLHLSPMSWNFSINCNFASKDFDVTFNNTATDTLNICAASWKVPLNKLISGAFKPSGDWSTIYGFNPAAGGWSIEVRDYANTHGGVDGAITSASITFTDLNFQGKMTTVTYTSGVIADSIFEPVTPSYEATSYQVPLALYTSCFNTCDAQGIVNITGGTGPYTLDWVDPSVPDKDTVFLCRGTYDLNVTDALGCSTSTSVEVLSPPAILYDSVVFTPSLACHGDLNGSVKVYAHGGVGTLSYSIDGGASFQASGTFAGLGAGTKNIVVKDANACTIDTLLVITEPAAITATVSTKDILCYGANSGELHVTASGGTAPYAYSYNAGISFTLSKDTIALAPGTYSVRVRDSKACVFDAGDYAILESAELLIDSVQVLQQINCNGDSASLVIFAQGGTGKLLYSLDGGLTQQTDSLFSKLGPGTWYPAVVDQNACTVLSDSIVFVNTAKLLIIAVDSTNVTCHGAMDGTITIIAAGGTGSLYYSIDGGTSSFKNGGLFTGIDAGSYPVEVTDSLGCIVNGPIVSISEPDGLNSFSLSYQNISCTGLTDGEITVTPQGGQAPYTYFLEKDGAPYDTLTDNGDGIFTDLGAGDYKVIITDANSCGQLVTPQFPILEPAPIAINSVTGTDPDCPTSLTGSVVVDAIGGTAYPSGRPFDYTIDGGQNWDTIQFTTLPAGIFFSGVRDSRGCVVLSDTVTLVDPPAPVLDSSNYAAVTGCWYNANGAVSFWAHGGAEPLQYSVGGAYQDTGIFVGVSAGDHILLVKDANGCVISLDTITVSSPSPILPIINTTDVSGDIKGTITVFASGGTPPLEFSIDATNYVPVGSSFGDLDVGSYTINIRDGAGCSLDSTVLITSTCTIVTTITPTLPTCHGVADGMLIVSAGGGTEPYEYSLDCGLNYSPSGIYTELAGSTYCIAVKDGTGQVCLTNFELLEPDALSTIASTNKANCNAMLEGHQDVGSIDLTVLGGSGNFTFTWTNEATDTISELEDLSNLSAGVYTVSIVDDKGCSTQNNYTVQADPARAVTVSLPEDTARLCAGSLLDVDGTSASASSYIWFDLTDSVQLGTDAELQVNPDSNALYLLTGYNSFFCAAYDTLVVEVWPLPIPWMPTDTFLLGGSSISLPLVITNSSEISNPVFAWDPFTFLNDASLQNPLFLPEDKGVDTYPYSVLVTSGNGCEQRDTITIHVLWNLTFPSGFTPNDDGINDTWVIPAAEAVPVSVDVFNRWGEHVYSASRYHNDWDGSFNNKPLSIGTYYYIVTIKVGSTKKTFSGPLTIVIQPEK